VRYDRQLRLPQIGPAGQKKLLAAKVLVIGAGGLGSPVSHYLAGAGIGHLGIVDSEAVEVENLHRQILYTSKDIGQKKALLAKEHLEEVNPDVKVQPYVLRLLPENINEILIDYDLVIDCTDNFSSRYLINDACVQQKKTLVHGAVFRTEGQVMVVKPGQGPCYNCVFPQAPDFSIKGEGVLGMTAGIIGLIQATEAVKLIIGIGEPLIGSLLIYNALTMSFRKIKIQQAGACPTCNHELSSKTR